MCVWEGASDYYRENTHHGGILSTFALTVNDFGVWPIQHGVGERGRRSRATGELVSGPETLSPEELKRNRIDLARSLLSHPLDDAYYRDRAPDWSKVKVPFLSAANWGGIGLHPRGNFEGFMLIARRVLIDVPSSPRIRLARNATYCTCRGLSRPHFCLKACTISGR